MYNDDFPPAIDLALPLGGDATVAPYLPALAPDNRARVDRYVRRASVEVTLDV